MKLYRINAEQVIAEYEDGTKYILDWNENDAIEIHSTFMDDFVKTKGKQIN